MSDWHLMRPEWLWALAPALLLTLMLWRLRGRGGSWSEVIDPQLLPLLLGGSTSSRRRNLLPLLLGAWVLAILAASGPSFQKIPQPVHQKQDALVLVLDLSYSMKSGDLAPSRIDRARQKLLDLLKQRKEGQTGLIAYAGDAHIVTPLTDDTPTIANLLPALNPDMMPVPGSDPVDAVNRAVELLHSAGVAQGRILLISDGIKHEQVDELSEALRGSGARLSVLGVGTASGAPIPLPRGGFLKDEDGTIVMPGLAESTLGKAAGDTGGRYARMRIDDSDLDYLLAETALPLHEQTLALDRSADTWEDQGYLLLVLVLPLILALFRRGWVTCLLPLLIISQPQPVQAGLWDDLWLTRDQQGQRALQQGDAEAAAELFTNPEWAGTANYQSGNFEAAHKSFSEVDSADGWYNRGNALAREGKLDEAIEAYSKSLERKPEQADALENIELLEQLKQQQQQQQGNSGEQNQDQNQDQDQDQDQDQQEQNPQEQQSQQDEQNSDTNANQDAENQGDPQQQQPEPREQQARQEGEQNPGQQSPEQQGENEKPSQTADNQDKAPDPENAQGQQQPRAAQADPEQQERDQAMEQWLRRIPDDPSGLLREKFRYESQKRKQQGARRKDESYW